MADARAPFSTRTGRRFPHGATVVEGGVNFSVFSRHAAWVELLLYEEADSAAPFQVIRLDPEQNRTFYSWHVLVEGLRAGVSYAWRADGPDDTATTGRRFNPRKALVDPWARAVTDEAYDRERCADPDDASHSSPRGLVVEPASEPRARAAPRGQLAGAVIYELHVGHFTRHPSSGVRHPGKFLGLLEKIPYLRDLGVTHVELMPVMAFDRQDRPPHVAARGMSNAWGYSPFAWWSPHPGYVTDPERGVHERELRAMVDALHDAGLGVILDVVFNHSCEGGADGPVVGLKGLANEVFYLLDPKDRRRYVDFTGCGNTLNANHPLVTRFALHCLEHWVQKMGVDGFRFDLASALTRGEDGAPLPNPPLPWAIELSPRLEGAALIAEAWDAEGLCHAGTFPGFRWAEWNGRFRDVMRRFVRGDAGIEGDVARCLSGSADLFQDDGRTPSSSVNFVTCHDGLTLRDLVTYARGHDPSDDRVGPDTNGWNCGAEGETEDGAVNSLRRRQAKNHVAVLMLSLGVPMLLMGDEVLRTQLGNRNAWCVDDESTWLDWRLVDSNGDMHRFVRELIALRRRHPALLRDRFLTGRPVPGRELPDVAWHGERLGEPPWRAGGSVLAFTLAGLAPADEDLHVVLNMSERPLRLDLPSIAGRRWHVAVDTSRPSPDDVTPPERQRPHDGAAVDAGPRSVVVLEARRGSS
jgi:glycogen operon protein